MVHCLFSDCMLGRHSFFGLNGCQYFKNCSIFLLFFLWIRFFYNMDILWRMWNYFGLNEKRCIISSWSESVAKKNGRKHAWLNWMQCYICCALCSTKLFFWLPKALYNDYIRLFSSIFFNLNEKLKHFFRNEFVYLKIVFVVWKHATSLCLIDTLIY